MASTSSHRSTLAGGSRHRSLFYHDLASPSTPSPSPAPPRSSRFVTPGQAAAVSALWKQNFIASSSDLPPPPAFTLEDRADFSPDAAPGELPSPVTPSPSLRLRGTPSSSESRGKKPIDAATPSTPQTTGNANWWSPVKGSKGKEEESSVERRLEPGAGTLVVLPPPREVVRPEVQEKSAPVGVLDEEEWVTVYGFAPADTNLVLREFEKCGPVLQHVVGPRDANWMHILYQNRYDAQKALLKNGVQLNSVLIVGVKPVDPTQRQFLNEKSSSSKKGFMVSLPPPLVNGSISSTSRAKHPPYILQANGGSSINKSHQVDSAIATPAKSVFSKAMDLMFGL